MATPPAFCYRHLKQEYRYCRPLFHPATESRCSECPSHSIRLIHRQKLRTNSGQIRRYCLERHQPQELRNTSNRRGLLPHQALGNSLGYLSASDKPGVGSDCMWPYALSLRHSQSRNPYPHHRSHEYSDARIPVSLPLPALRDTRQVEPRHRESMRNPSSLQQSRRVPPRN